MKRPLVIISISYIFGIIIGVYFKWSIPLILLAGAILILLRKNWKNAITKSMILALAVTIFAGTITIRLNNKYESLFSQFDGNQMALVGTVCSSVKATNYRYIVTLEVQQAAENKKGLNNNASKKYGSTKLIISVTKDENNLDKLSYGNKIVLLGEYAKPEDSRNYKGFSYFEYLKTKQTYGTVDVASFSDIEIIKENNLGLINLTINNLTQKLDSNLKQLLPEELAGLSKGILLGDSSDISEEIKENFKECNLSHMLAVSGSHLAYLVLGLNLILNKKICGIRNSKYIKIIVIVIFMLITNMSPSVTRAGISVILALVASLIHRKPDTYTTIAVASLFTLLQNPFSLFNVGMQLSYLGTIGIILFNQKIYEYLKSKLGKKGAIKDYILQSISVTLSANMLIFPLVMYNFNTISLNFILSNLIAGPILGICIILGLFMLLTSLVSIQIAKIIAFALKIFLNILIKITSIISKIPFGNITIVTPHIATIIAIYAIIACLYIVMQNKEKADALARKIRKLLSPEKTKGKYIKAISVICIFVIILSCCIFFISTNKDLKIYFIDVGQGDSTLICSPSGKNILIDGGGSLNPENYDVGEIVLVPYLLDRRIKKLDYIMVSHFDADHSQGLEAVIKTIKVECIVVSKQASQSAQYDKIISLCEEYNVNVVVVKRGGTLQIDEYIYFKILHPGDKMLDDGKGGLNANAIVAKLYYKTSQKYFTMLFTGDIEEVAEKELVKTYGDYLKCDILKVAHHGSKTSSTEEFLEKALPSIALIGVGKNNTFGHPNEGVLERLKEINARIYRTDINGEISIKINQKGQVAISGVNP